MAEKQGSLFEFEGSGPRAPRPRRDIAGQLYLMPPEHISTRSSCPECGSAIVLLEVKQDGQPLWLDLASTKRSGHASLARLHAEICPKPRKKTP